MEKNDYLDENTRFKNNVIHQNNYRDDALLKLLQASDYAKNIVVWRQCYMIDSIYFCLFSMVGVD